MTELHRYHYDSLADYVDHASKRPSVSGWARNSLSSAPERIAGTAGMNFKQTVATALSGWKEGADKIIKGLESADRSAGALEQAPDWSFDVAGEFPDVAAFCAGELEHMVTPEPVFSRPAPAITIMVQGSMGFIVTAEHCINYGVALLSYVASLQQAGRSVRLCWYHYATGDDASEVLTTVDINDPSAPLDLDRAAFVLAHAGMLRRIRWAADEQRPELKDAFSDGYGQPIRDKTPADITGEYGVLWAPDRTDLCVAGHLDAPENAVRHITAALDKQQTA